MRSRATLIASTAIMLAGTVGSVACEMRQVALRAATLDSCGTIWSWNSALDIGDLYLCNGPDCGPETVLRVTRSPMNAEDKPLDSAALLADWEQRVIPAEMNGFRFEMMGPITTPTLAGVRGALISIVITNPDGQKFNSHAFRIPLKGDYLIVNATGKTDPDKLRGFLTAALGNIAIAGDAR